jgi:hypothetical protein
VAIGAEQRRRERHAQVAALYGTHTEAALDLLDLADRAWHDSYPADLALRPDVLADVLLLAAGDLAELVRVARLAVVDFRDVRLATDAVLKVRRHGRPSA